jgi:hypothetical protein
MKASYTFTPLAQRADDEHDDDREQDQVAGDLGKGLDFRLAQESA